MKYPMKSNWISYLPIKNEDAFIVKDHVSDEETVVDGFDISFIEKLDGNTNPAKLLRGYSAKEVNCYLNYLESKNLIRFSKTVLASFPTFIRTLIIINDETRYKKAAIILNRILMLGFIPMIIIACCLISSPMLSNLPINYSIASIIAGYVFGIISGIIFHEIGHAASGIAYGGKVMEFGLNWNIFFSVYTMIDSKQIKNRMCRIQVNLAGIEANFMLASLYSIILVISAESFADNCMFWKAAALSNITLGLLNLLIIDGMDGMHIIQEILNSDDILSSTKKSLKNNTFLNTEKRDTAGLIKVLSAVIIQLTRLFMPILILTEFAFML